MVNSVVAMKTWALVIAVLGLGLVTTTISPPQGTRLFIQAVPPNSEPIVLLGKSHLSLLADLFWIRTIGVTITLKVPADGRSLINWCTLVTELDPKYVYPYMLGGLLGPMPSALGTHNVQEAGRLLQKGMSEIPQDHRLPLYLSYNQLYLEKDIRAAAETLRRGSLVKGAPSFMGALATRLLAQSEDFEAASSFAEELARNSTDPDVRQMFERRRLEVERDRRLVMLQRAVDAFRSSRGQVPEDLMQLLAEGFLQELPRDPLDGGDFELRPDGRVTAPSGARLKAFLKTDQEITAP